MRGKKSLVLAVCLCMEALTAGAVSASETAAVAETLQVTLLDTIETSEWVYGSPAVRIIYGETGAALAAADGTLITEPIYEMWEFQYNYGYFTAMESENWVSGRGVLAEDGNIVIPFQYGSIDVLSPEWAVAYTWVESSADHYDNIVYGETDRYYRCETADIYYLPDRVCAGSISCDEFQEAAVAGYSINIQSRSTGLISTYDRQFNLLSTAASHIFDDTYAETEYTRFYENGLCGLKDRNGNTVLNFPTSIAGTSA